MLGRNLTAPEATCCPCASPSHCLEMSGIRAQNRGHRTMLFYLELDPDNEQPHGMKHKHNHVVRVAVLGRIFRPWRIPPATVRRSQEPCPLPSRASKRSPLCRSCGADHGVGPPPCTVEVGARPRTAAVACHCPGHQLGCVQFPCVRSDIVTGPIYVEHLHTRKVSSLVHTFDTTA